MNSKALVIVFLGVLLLMSTGVNAVVVEPQMIDIQGRPGTFQIRTITIENRENHKVNVSIEVSPLISNYYLPKISYTLDPYEEREIQFGVTINKSVTATITYYYDDEDYFTQILRINATNVQPNLLMFPQQPSGGDGVNIMLMSKKLINAQAVVVCSQSNNSYAFSINQGIGSFKLKKDEPRGTAVMRIIGEDIDPIFYTFNITGAKPSEDDDDKPELSIDLGDDDDIEYGTSRIVTLKLDDDPVEGTFIITKPSGNKVLKTTDKKGRISIEFDEGGIWSIEAEANEGNYTANKGVAVQRNDMTIKLPDGEIVTGREVVMEAAPGATIELKGPQGTTVMQADEEGIFKWKPEKPGEYKIEAYTDQASGKETIEVWQHISLRVQQSGIYSNQVIKGVPVTIEVTDGYGEKINTVETIKLEGPVGTVPVNVDVTSGSLQWTPDKTGVYTFTVADNEENYIYGDKLTVQSISSGEGGSNNGIIIVIGVLVAAAILIIIIKKREGNSGGPGPSGKTTKQTGMQPTLGQRIKKSLGIGGGQPPFWKE